MPNTDEDKADEEQLTQKEVNVRDCLICGGPTRYGHMGIDSCRACAMFYKRMGKRKQQLVCRTGSLQCDTTKIMFAGVSHRAHGMNRGSCYANPIEKSSGACDVADDKYCCKKCRYDRITAVLAESKKPRDDYCRSDPSLLTEEANAPSSSSISLIQFAPPLAKTTMPQHDVIASVRQGYSLMNTIRRTSELSTRMDVCAEQGIIVDGMVVIPTTYGMMNQTTRILISSIFEFASTAFEEFKTLNQQEQTLLVRNFYPFISSLDSSYRMHKLLPDREMMCFGSYASYLDLDTIQQFLSDTPNTSTRNRKDATRMIECYLTKEVWSFRSKMKRWNPTEDEFSAFVGLGFWSLENIVVSDAIHQIADKYRKMLFLELEMLYRETLHLDEYAYRMGEAMLFLTAVQYSFFEMKYSLGVFKLMDVFDDQMLMAQLHL